VFPPTNPKSDSGILGKTPGRPPAHLDNPKVAVNKNPRVVTACLPGNQNNANPKSKRLFGKQADPSLATATKKDSPKNYTWTCRLCNHKIESTTARGISVPKHRHFKTKHPGHKKAPEDKFHAQELQQPDLGEPTDTKAAGPNHPTKLTLEAISIHNKSKNHTPIFDEPPTFGCPKKRKRDHAKAADKGSYNWWCPFCESDIPVRGDSKGQFWRKKHLKTIHNKTLKDCPSQGSTALTNRAMMRAKQMQAVAPDDAQHNLLHVKQNKLQDCVPDQTTWICTTCLAKGNTAHMGNTTCNPQAKNAGRAKWIQGLTEDQSQLLQSTLGYTVDQWTIIRQQAQQLIANSKKRTTRYASDKAYNDMLKIKRKNWRKNHGQCANAQQASGATNSKNIYIPTARCSLGIKATSSKQAADHTEHNPSRASAKQQDINKPIQNGPNNTWTLDLTTCGDVEPNPGPQDTTLKIWQINIASYHLRTDILATATQEGIHAILMQETRLSDLEVDCINNTNRQWQLFQASTDTTHQHEAPKSGTAIFIRRNIPAVLAKKHADQEGEWIDVAIPGLHIISAYRRPGINKQPWTDNIGKHLASLGSGKWFMGGDFNGNPLEDPLLIYAHSLHANVVYPHQVSDQGDEADNADPPEPVPTR